MVSPKQFRQAMEACLDRADAETMSEEKMRLISAALLFAQVAEHLDRGNLLTPRIVTRCRFATSTLDDGHTRRSIKGLLEEIIC